MIVKTIITNFIFRQEAVDYMVANTALSRVAVEGEVKTFFKNQYFLKIDIVKKIHYPWLHFEFFRLIGISLGQVKPQLIRFDSKVPIHKKSISPNMTKNVNKLRRFCIFILGFYRTWKSSENQVLVGLEGSLLAAIRVDTAPPESFALSFSIAVALLFSPL